MGNSYDGSLCPTKGVRSEGGVPNGVETVNGVEGGDKRSDRGGRKG